MDFDADGVPDVLSGSWPGELYFFRGQGSGKFAAPVVLKGGDGRPIKPGSASTVFAGDLNGDGRLDLVLGNIEGQVQFVPGVNGAGPSFGTPAKLKANGAEIKAPGGDSHPVLADWNGDGRLDLVLGAGDGSVLLYLNQGSAAAPAFGRAETLLKGSPMEYALGRKSDAQAITRGMRAKISVADWNGDGRLDLLVGEFGMTMPPEAAGEQKKQDAAMEQYVAADRKLAPYHTALQKLGRAPSGGPPRERWNRDRARLRDQYKTQLAARQAALQKLMAVRVEPTYRGNVWLYLGQAAGAAVAGAPASR